MPCDTGEKFAEGVKELRGRVGTDDGKIRSHHFQLLPEHCFHEREFAGEMGIERLLAHAQLRSQIVHRDAAETLRQEVPSGSGHNPLPGRVSHRMRTGW